MKKIIITLVFMFSFLSLISAEIPGPALEGKCRIVLFAHFYALGGNVLPYTVHVRFDGNETINFITKDSYLVIDAEPGRHLIEASKDSLITKYLYEDKVGIYLSEGKTAYLRFYITDSNLGSALEVSATPADSKEYSRRGALSISY